MRTNRTRSNGRTPRYVAVFLAAAVIVALGCSESEDGSGPAASGTEPAGDVSVSGCGTVTEGVGKGVVAVTNRDSVENDYDITVEFSDPTDSSPLASTTIEVNGLQPEQATLTPVISDQLGTSTEVACKVVDVIRTATAGRVSMLRDATADVELTRCEAAADSAKGWEADVAITNNSSDPSDYTILVVLESADGATQYGSGEADAQRLVEGRSATDTLVIAEGLDLPSYMRCRISTVARTATLDLIDAVGTEAPDDVKVTACKRSADPTLGWQADLAVTNSTADVATYVVYLEFTTADGETQVDHWDSFDLDPDEAGVDVPAGETVAVTATGERTAGLPADVRCGLLVTSRIGD